MEISLVVLHCAIYLGLYFHCASHAACTHIPFQKLAIALVIGFSSESVLKYERLKPKINLSECLVGFFEVFFEVFFIERQIFADERRREARLHEVTKLICVVPHWHARIRLFYYFLFLFFEPSCQVTVFFCSFFTCLFCVEALALRNKKEKKKWRGEETVRERRYFQKKKGGGGRKGNFEWFLCARSKIGERQAKVWTFSRWKHSRHQQHTYSFTRLSDKSPPLPNARHEGTRIVSYRSSSLCCRTAWSWRVEGKPWGLVTVYLYLYGSNSGLMMRFGKVSWTKFMATILGQRTFAPSWEQNSTWADAPIPSVSPLAFAPWPRSRRKSLQFHLLNLSRETSETVLHYTIVFEKKLHEIFVNQDEQRLLPIIVWTSIAKRLVKHDPWSSPGSDVTVHDVILHCSHLQIFSGCVCHLKQLYAQFSFLFPIVFGIKAGPPPPLIWVFGHFWLFCTMVQRT